MPIQVRKQPIDIIGPRRVPVPLLGVELEES